MESLDSKTAGKKLSAEAESFIPSHLKPVQKIEVNETAPIIPHYVTSCYPFVSEAESEIRPRHSWQQYGGFPSQATDHIGFSHPGMFPFTGKRPPGPQSFSPTLSQNHVYRHRPPHITTPVIKHSQPPSILPGVIPNSPVPRLISTPPNVVPTIRQIQTVQRHRFYMSSISNTNSPFTTDLHSNVPHVWLNASNDAQGYHNNRNPYQSHLGYSSSSLHQSSGVRVKDQRKNKKKDAWNKMVSVGVQNENTGSYQQNLKKKARPRTIIYLDANVQTDFSDELANKTLAEKPSSIYQKEWTINWLQLYQDSTTESEEVDSDSGYSSPMHRKKQASSGTHPLTAIDATPPNKSITTPQQQHYSPAAVPQTNQKFPFSGYSAAVISGGCKNWKQKVTIDGSSQNRESRFIQSQSNSTLKTAYKKQVVVQSDKDISIHTKNHAKHKTNIKTKPKPDLLDQVSDTVTEVEVPVCTNLPSPKITKNSTVSKNVQPNSLRTYGLLSAEEGAMNVGSDDGKGKKKRKRSRKKKSKSNASEKSGVLSDGFEDQPASNLNPTALIENKILHFEDENEFPNLLSAAGGLSDGNPASDAPFTYSDILKGQQSFNILSQDSNYSYSSGGFKSCPESTSVKNSHENKNSRKRRKRQEAVDHAADLELAEITLEQQQLRELSAKTQKKKEKQKQLSVNLPADVKAVNAGTGGVIKIPSGGGKKSKQPISLSIADMINALEKQERDTKVAKKANTQKPLTVNPNLLDSNAPKKRGKERENPKSKRPSPLKKVILKEREEKKRLRLLEDGVTTEVSIQEHQGAEDEITNQDLEGEDTETEDNEQELEQDDDDENQNNLYQNALENKCDSSNVNQEEITRLEPCQEDSSNQSSLEVLGETGTGSADLSPISQTSPISMSPLSGSPCNSGVNSPIASNSVLGTAVSSSVLTRIHSRRFREYCTQILDKDIDQCCATLLQDLVRFQERVYHKDPTKGKSKRRLVLGLREVAKHLKLKKLKCVIISPNLERIQSKGGLDEALNNIINDCQMQNIPFVFALGRRALGRACAKLVPVSVVGIFSYDGTEEQFKKLMELTEKARQQYTDMVSVMEKELLDSGMTSKSVVGMIPPLQPSANSMSSSDSIIPKLFPHMGHSRTPSACSAISFCSSILSEPISENYPHSEPETDSRGYEIVRNVEARSNDVLAEKLQSIELHEDDGIDKSSGQESKTSHSNNCLMETLNDIDEGHEADTEEDHTLVGKKRHQSNNSQRFSSSVERNHNKELCTSSQESINSVVITTDTHDSLSNSTYDENDDSSSYCENDVVKDLPHIEGLYSITHELSAEILSQHSSKTMDDVLSTHSSKTIEATGSQTPDRLSRNMGSASDLHEASTPSDSGAHKIKTMDKERIETWVLETQRQIEMLSTTDSSTEESSQLPRNEPTSVQ